MEILPRDLWRQIVLDLDMSALEQFRHVCRDFLALTEEKAILVHYKEKYRLVFADDFASLLRDYDKRFVTKCFWKYHSPEVVCKYLIKHGTDEDLMTKKVLSLKDPSAMTYSLAKYGCVKAIKALIEKRLLHPSDFDLIAGMARCNDCAAQTSISNLVCKDYAEVSAEVHLAQLREAARDGREDNIEYYLQIHEESVEKEDFHLGLGAILSGTARDDMLDSFKNTC